MSLSLMMKLGLVLKGSNEDLIAIMPPKKDDEDNGEGEGEDSDNDEEDDDGSSEDEEDNGSGSSSEDEDGEGSEDNEEDEDNDGSDSSSEEDSEGNGSDSAPSSGEESPDSEGEEGEGDENEGDKDSPVSRDSSQAQTEDHSEHGQAEEEGEVDTSDQEIAQSLLDAMTSEEETGLKDSSEALSEAVKAQGEAPEDLEQGEQEWRPYYPDKDVVKTVSATDASKEAVIRMRATVKTEISFLKNKLRSKFLQARQPKTFHGVRKGQGLSERRLVNSFVELKSGRRPTAPDWRRDKVEDVSLACAIVLDESGSMSALTAKVGQAALAIAEPLDVLGSPCLVVGPRDAGRDFVRNYEGTPSDYYENDGKKDQYGNPISRFHRLSHVVIDVFKGWDESMTVARNRFGRVQAVGSTPLEDGIQFALQELNHRPERHRVVLVITDGSPNNSNVVRHQIRLAEKAGVHIVGVGVDAGCWNVTKLFPEHVAVLKISELPEKLLEVLDNIIFPAAAKKMTLDGKMNTKKTA